MNLGRAIQAQFQNESRVAEKSGWDSIERENPVRHNLDRAGNLQAGLDNFRQIFAQERFPTLQADECNGAQSGKGPHDLNPLAGA